MGMMSKRKGRAGEQELCRLLKEALGDIGLFERNSMQAHGIEGMSQKDILTNLPLAIECKRTEDFNPKKWLVQARTQNEAGRLPVVAHRANGEPWRFLFELTGPEFIRMVRGLVMFQKLPVEEQRRLLAGGTKVGSDLLHIEGSNAAE